MTGADAVWVAVPQDVLLRALAKMQREYADLQHAASQTMEVPLPDGALECWSEVEALGEWANNVVAL